ncbi:MAG: hypothetical protein Q8N51_02335, partial [Gammaproteobacteria bacterium]|nr:hypothetical protein [Gammaproteobacteria bacterium]
MTEYRLMPWAEAFAAYGPEWLAIGKARGVNLTLLPDWTRIVVECLTEPAGVRILAGTDGARLTSLVPFHIREGRISQIPVRFLEPISGVVAYHAEFISRDSPAGLLRALVQTREQLSWDVIRLAGILSGSPTEQAILEVARDDALSLIHRPGRQSPYFPLGATGEEMVARRNKRDRYLIRKHAKDFAATAGG